MEDNCIGMMVEYSYEADMLYVSSCYRNEASNSTEYFWEEDDAIPSTEWVYKDASREAHALAQELREAFPDYDVIVSNVDAD